MNDNACDSCLRANADSLSSKHHSPAVAAAGDLVSWDTYKVSVPYKFGGQQIVLNFHDHYSRVNKPYLLKSESETPAYSIDKYFGWCAAKGVSVRRLNTDNAKAFISKVTRTTIAHHGAHGCSS